ncbi:MAG: hypothetical protein J6W23_12875, partial [Victivallales bacterium]|nr:hypothetical protein [Victivallales bacterium]
HRFEDVIDITCMLCREESEGPPSARRFVTLRASENNVMRKLEIHSLSTMIASVCSVVCKRLA